MNKKIVALISVIAISSCFLFTVSVNAQSLSIDPPQMNVVGNIGDLIIQTVFITNNENVSVEVTVNYSGTNNVFMPSNTIMINAGGTKEISIGFVVEKEEVSWITYFVNSDQFNQLVMIDIEKTDPSLMVFPSNPVPGKSVAFLLMGEGILDAHGFLFCSESGGIYPIVINDGIGTIQLGVNESGEAIARITGEGINPLFANFTIGSSSNSGSNSGYSPPVLSLSAPSSVIIGETRDISVIEGTKPMMMTSVLISKPNGESYELVTNSFGKINVHFNEIGVWKATIVSGAQIITNDISCSKKQETLALLTDDPMTNMQVDIQAFQDSAITITYPDGTVKNGVDNGGSYSFNPSKAGRYSIHAESTTATGDISFDVKSRPRIIITDIGGNLVDYKSNVGKMVYLRVVDSNNNPLGVDSVLKIRDSASPFGIPMDVNIYDSVGMWTPQKSGIYVIEFPGYGVYTSAEASLTISDSGFVFGELLPYIGVGGILLAGVFIWRRKLIFAWVESKIEIIKAGRSKSKMKEPR